MTGKIFKSILAVAASVLFASLLLVVGVLYEYFGDLQNQRLSDELSLAVSAVTLDGQGYLENISSDSYRLTWIDADGSVIYDTRADAGEIENHADREEFREAMESGEGKSTRYSATLMKKTTYFAKRLSDGTVLRISTDYATAALLVLGMIQPVLVIAVAALVLSAVLASSISRRIVRPLNNLNLDDPLSNDTYDEIAPLLSRIDRQHKQIRLQLSELRQKTDEFSQIIASMREGLVLLDEKGCVLSINPAAIEVFGVGDDAVGKDFLVLDRGHDMSSAISEAMKSGHAEVREERLGRIYRFDISRIESDGNAIGAVILAFDTTEQDLAEQNRREFTANVSHELKTPLQGIIGSADLIESGMVKDGDMPRFVGHIKSEATRLLLLIEDIIRLSQLDEGDEMPLETVDLLALAGEVEDDLGDAAAAKNIKMSLEGDGASICGVRRLLYEVVYNLCDNAIKYNNDGGEVRVYVGSSDDRATVRVSDNGIGIAPEHQSRVFERFYRVDKSHSKASGGTGLGLSIVKHAVMYHRGEIKIESELGRGTTITLTFPIKRTDKSEPGEN